MVQQFRRMGVLLVLALIGIAKGSSQQIAIKNNLFYDGVFLTPNASVEISTGKKHTLEIMGAVNPFTYSNNKKFKHWLLQPEYRYWFCSRFNGWFVGVHAHGGQFNVGNYKLPFGILHTVKDYRYEGWFVGGGASIGYQWVLSRHWGLEAEIGAGYAYLDYRKYPCATCGKKLKDSSKGYFGPTRAAISLVYVIK